MAKLYKPKNTLKEKVGDGGFREEDLKRAQAAIDENDVDFTPLATKYLNKLHQSLTQYNEGQDASTTYDELLNALTQLRAQGSMFQYSSITVITDTVVDLLDSLGTVDSTIIEIIEAYEKSAKVLLSSQIKDDRNVVCNAVAKELKGVCQRYKDKM